MVNQYTKRWTTEEDQVLKELYPSASQEEIMKVIPTHSWQGIRNRAWKYGLPRNTVSISLIDSDSPIMSDFDRGYISAFLDGEGHIAVRKYSNTNSQRLFKPRVGFTNNNKEVLDWIRTRLGGNLHLQGRKSHTYQLDIESVQMAYRVLKFLEPSLKIKRRQAQLVLEFCESRRSHNFHNHPYTERELEIVGEIKSLNSGGHG